jgi:surfeit locus 1 family protein
MLVFRRPSLFSLLLLSLGLVFFISLGNWQTRRALEKDRLWADFQTTNAPRALNLADALVQFPARAYVPVQITGEFVANKSLLLDSARLSGQIGVQVFQAFRTTQGQSILVGLGFVPIAPDRSQFPLPKTPNGTMRLHGLIAAPPSSGLRLAGNGKAPDTPTWLVTYIDPATQGGFFGVTLVQPVLLLEPVANPGKNPEQVLQLARVWHPASMTPQRHRGYAFTWYGFALTTVIIFFVFMRKRP